MPVLRTYECPSCNGRFEVLHKSWKDGIPNQCELCGEDFGSEDGPEGAGSGTSSGASLQLELPGLNIGGSALARSADKHYRDMERSPAGITNLNDNLRMGDQAGKALHAGNSVTMAAAAQMEQLGMQQWQSSKGGSAQAVIKGSPSGAAAGAIDKMALIQQRHAGANAGQPRPPNRLQPGLDVNSH